MLHSERLDHIMFWKRTMRSSGRRFQLLVKILHTCQGGYLYCVTVLFLLIYVYFPRSIIPIKMKTNDCIVTNFASVACL